MIIYAILVHFMNFNDFMPTLNHSPSNPLVRKRAKVLLFRPGMLNIRSRDFNRAQNVNKRRMRIRMANEDSRYYDT